MNTFTGYRKDFLNHLVLLAGTDRAGLHAAILFRLGGGGPELDREEYDLMDVLMAAGDLAELRSGNAYASTITEVAKDCFVKAINEARELPESAEGEEMGRNLLATLDRVSSLCLWCHLSEDNKRYLARFLWLFISRPAASWPLSVAAVLCKTPTLLVLSRALALWLVLMNKPAEDSKLSELEALCLVPPEDWMTNLRVACLADVQKTVCTALRVWDETRFYSLRGKSSYLDGIIKIVEEEREHAMNL